MRKSSFWWEEERGEVVSGRRVEIGWVEVRESRWLERVERRKRVVWVVVEGGRRVSSSSRRAEIGVDGGRVRARVGGRPAPGKLVMSTLILLGDIVGGIGMLFDERSVMVRGEW